MPSIRANTHLAEREGWSFRPPKNTPNSGLSSSRLQEWHQLELPDIGAAQAARAAIHNTGPHMVDLLGFWEFVARDFERQASIPSLRSGNTVVDERNFSMV